MKKISNYSAFYGLLNRMWSDDKEALKASSVVQYTAGRTSSLREMTGREYFAALEGMKKMVATTNCPEGVEWEDAQKMIMRKKRSAVLHQMQLIGIDTSDWTRVDSYCLDKRIAGKRFGRIGVDELDKLLVKLRAIRRKGVE